MKQLKKALAVFLAILTIFTTCSVVMPVFAEYDFVTSGNVTNGNVQEDTVLEEETEPQILSEITEKREENAKHFRMSDGSYIVAQYNTPVHYLNENGEWADIDNTIYEAEATTEQTVLFGTDELYSTENGAENVVFAGKSNSNTLVSYEAKDYPISFNYQSAKNSQINIIEKTETYSGDDAFLSLPDITQEVVYEDVFADVDLQYIVSPTGLKENIILKSESAQNSFTVNYNIGELTAEVVDINTINLMAGDEIVYTISAPYMTDANGERSESVTLTVEKNKNGKLRLVIGADESWLSAEGRAYPVVVDPIITESESSQLIATYISSENSNVNYGALFDVQLKKDSTGNEKWVLIKLDNLTDSIHSDRTVSAKLNLPLMGSVSTNLQTELYEINAPWNVQEVNYNTELDLSNNVVDYCKLTQESTALSFDITELYCKATDSTSECHGALLKLKDNGTVDFKVNNGTAPVLILKYVSTVGLDESYSYSQFDMGTVGTVYINNLTGNLIITRDETNTTGEDNPYYLTSTYNSFAPIKSQTPCWFRDYEYGFRSETEFINENGTGERITLGETSDNGFYTVSENSSSLTKIRTNKDSLTDETVSIDALNEDETARYNFDPQKGLTGVFDTETGNALVTVTRESDSNIQIVDSDGDKLEITNTDSLYSVKQFYTQKNLYGDTVEYTKDTNGNVTQITLNGNVQALFTYDELNRMTSVTNDVGYKLTFGYNGESKIVSTVSESKNGTNGQHIAFERQYNRASVRSSGADGVFGNSDDVISECRFNKNAQLTQVQNKTHSGEDLGAVAYSYKNDSESAASSEITRVSAVGKNVVNLLKNHNLESADNWTVTRIADSQSTYTACHTTEKSYTGLGSLKITTEDFTRNGSVAYMQRFTPADGELTAGKTYTASAFINTQSLQRDSDIDLSRGYGAGVIVRVTADKTDYIYSDSITETTESVNNGWERTFATFTVPVNCSRIDILLTVRNAIGTAYYDSVQLEEGETPNEYNVLQNNGFDLVNSSSLPEFWQGENLSAGDVAQNGQMKIIGEPGTQKKVSQTVYLKDAEQSDSYTFSAWAKAGAVPYAEVRDFDIKAEISYENGGSTLLNVCDFDYHDNGRQYVTGSFNLSNSDETLKPVAIRLLLCYYNQCNEVYFDNVALYPSETVYDLEAEQKAAEPVETKDGAGNVLAAVYPDGTVYEYTYHALGNDKYVVKTESVTEVTGEETTETTVYEYNTSEQLIKLTKSDGTIYNYTYDSDGNLLSKLTADGVGDRYTYNDNGDVTQELYEDGSSYVYTYYANGKLNTETATEDGITTVYTYAQNGNLLSEAETDAEGNSTQTVYTYDSFDNLLTVSENGTYVQSYTYEYFDTNGDNITDKTAVLTETLEDGTQNIYDYYDYGKLKTQTTTKGNTSLTYHYDIEGNLIKVDHNGFSYIYEYDAFGNQTNVKVYAEKTDGDDVVLFEQSLINYTYHPDKSKVNSVAYGDESYFNYTYDPYGNIYTKQSTQGTVLSKHDAWGKSVYERDTATGRKTYYKYDNLGNLYGEKVTSTAVGNSGNNFLYSSYNSFDEKGNVVKNRLTTNSGTLTTNYAYDSSGLPTQTTITSTRKVNYTYEDDVLNERTLTTSTPVTEAFTYNDEGYISSHTITHGEEDDDVDEYSYTYDDKGNITEIKKNDVVRQSYVYDENNQLIRENDRDVNKTVIYEYDNYGNIDYKSEFAFTLGELNGLGDITDYSYDTDWKDKLTSYDGQNITYDNMGNPTNYMGATMSWYARQMQSYSKNGTEITYKYDSNGLRTEKTVNGVKHEYYYVDGQLRFERNGDSYEIYYNYDAEGRPVRAYKKDLVTGTNYSYYLITNTRGDVIETRDGDGNVNAKFVYNSWGKLISVTDGNGNELGTDSFAYQISLKYRGYVYDWETGLYYLQSRYYDPEVGRFLNADSVDYIGYSDSVISYNVFAYCENNAVNCVDVSGYISQRINSNAQDELAVKYLEKFLDYLEFKNIIERSNLKRDKNYIYYIDIRYIESAGEYKGDILKLSIRFGDKSAWQKSSYWHSNFNDITSNFTDYISGAMQDVRDPDDVYAMAIPLVFWIGLLLGEYIKSSTNKKNYNRVWGEKGIDPNNTNSYYLFEGKWSKYSVTLLYVLETKTGEVEYIAY